VSRIGDGRRGSWRTSLQSINRRPGRSDWGDDDVVIVKYGLQERKVDHSDQISYFVVQEFTC
jgi:hypothetical protein